MTLSLSLEHGHEHDRSDTGSVNKSDRASLGEASSSTGTPRTISPSRTQERQRQRSTTHRRSQSIPVRKNTDSFGETFGHPATLRESFIIAADEMRKARGSSPPPRGHSHTFPIPAAPASEEARGRRDPSSMSDNTLTPRTDEPRNETDETTPLIRRDYADGEVNHVHKSKSPSAGHSHVHGSMNMKAILLHVLGDALGNVGVIATGLIIWQTNWSFKYYFDPIISLVITVIIFSSAMPLGKSCSLETTR